MKTHGLTRMLAALVAVLLGVLPALASDPPVVTNVVVSQRQDASRYVDIFYDLANPGGGACTVTVLASDDGGATWAVPIKSTMGDVGAGILPGTGRHIIWDTTADIPGVFGDQFKIRICASDYDIDDGLVGYWRFDEGSGNVAHDSSGHGNHGTIHGATWVDGISGSALNFDGIDDYVRFTTPVLNSPPYTICTWVRPVSVTGAHRYVIANGGETTYSYGFYTKLQPHGVWQFGVKRSDAQFGWTEVGATAGEWALLSTTWDGGTAQDSLRIYINGVPVATGAFAQWATGAPKNLRMGRPSTDELYSYRGALDEIRIYNRALSAHEIQQLYLSVPTPPAPPESTDGDRSDSSRMRENPIRTAIGDSHHDETNLAIAWRGEMIPAGRGYNNRAAELNRKASRSHIPLGPGLMQWRYIRPEPDAPQGGVGVHHGDGHADYWINEGPARSVWGNDTLTQDKWAALRRR